MLHDANILHTKNAYLVRQTMFCHVAPVIFGVVDWGWALALVLHEDIKNAWVSVTSLKRKLLSIKQLAHSRQELIYAS